MAFEQPVDQRPKKDSQPARSKKLTPKEMTTIDDLTHDFMNCASYREHCMNKYGQYVTHQGYRITL